VINARPGEADEALQSALVDLGTVPLTMLRTLDGAVFDLSLRRVVDQVSGPREANRGSCSQREID
jgi:FXSXX-COOH protein